MKLISTVAVTLLGLSAAAALLMTTSCGILSAPVSVPAAVLDNANFDLKFAIFDRVGSAISGVVFSQTLNHRFWEPISGYTTTHEVKTKQIDGSVPVNERGEMIQFAFSRNGFLETTCSMNAADTHTIITPYGNWPYSADFPIVMIPDRPLDADLRFWGGNIETGSYPTQRVIKLPMLWGPDAFADGQLKERGRVNPAGWTNTMVRQPPNYIGPANATRGRTPIAASPIPVQPFSMENVESGALPPGTLYLTLTRQDPQPINSKNELDPVEVGLPGRMVLHIAGAGNGFVAIAPKLGQAPILVSDTAPASGYADLTIERPRLRAMRVAGFERIIEGFEYFYIKAEGHYGKGCISWSQPYNPKSNAAPTPSFRCVVWMEAREGDVDLTWHHGLAK